MDRGLALVATLGVGALVAFQPPVNAMLARHVGDLGAAFTSLALSTLIIGVMLLAAGEVGELRGLSGFRPVHALGGIAGAAIVFVSLVTVRSLGAGGVAAALVTTQLVTAALLDRAGVLDLTGTPLSGQRLLGIALLVAGTILVTSR
jgi:bacterial/archaeal transporter family-2 protein